MQKNFKVTRIKEGEKKPTRFFSSAQEKKVAESCKGQITRNSGATPFEKGDVLTEKVLIECKTHTKNKETFTLHKEWLEKNEKEALFMGKDFSAVAFNFGPKESLYYIIDEQLFQKLLEIL